MHSSNIQIEEGIEALREELNTTIDKSVPTDLYIKLLARACSVPAVGVRALDCWQ